MPFFSKRIAVQASPKIKCPFLSLKFKWPLQISGLTTRMHLATPDKISFTAFCRANVEEEHATFIS